ncbi:MAG TPA: ATP-binding protein [Pyrinomonadaceae bacterium]|nr:ATP-binding protein [Pyrinomonadaceae bacterium]
MKDLPQSLLIKLLDATVDGVFAFDRDGHLTAWNDRMEQLSGLQSSAVIGKSYRDLFPGLIDTGEDSYFDSALAGEKSICRTSAFANHSSTQQRLDAHYSPLTNEHGQIVGGIGILHAPSSFQTSYRAADDPYHRLTKHLENSPLAVVEWDSDFRVSRWSESAEALFGWEAEEVLGKHVNEWHFVFADDVNAVDTVTFRQREGLEIQGVLYNRNYKKDGSVIHCEWYNSVLHDETGNLVSVLSLVLDVTDRKLAEKERAALLVRERNARRHAEEADRLKDEFLATLSHELRTPLTSILGWASMIRNGEVEGANAARAIETIERNARSQARLIDDLLDVSRIITGNLRLDLNPLDLGPIVDSAVDALRPTADAKGIGLRMEFAPVSCLVRGDANRLRQVIWNLLSNAIKFTPKRGHVTITLDCIESLARLTVRDTGEGISAEFLPYVFDRFRQAEGSISRKQGGLGLGLAVVRHLVELHGGNVSANSEGLDKGSTFQVELPMAQERRDPARAEERRQEIERRRTLGGERVSLDGIHVLLVEDDEDSRKLLSVMLRQHGAEVTSASRAAEAFRLFNEKLPDVLISDIGMPEQDGYELMRRIRDLPVEKGGLIPALALTGYATRKDHDLSLSAGYHRHIAKPIEQEELVAAIASLVGRRA